MPRVLTDPEIAELLGEAKALPKNWQSRIKPKPKARYQFDERQLDLTTEPGHEFRIVIRRNRQNPLDFSIILMFIDTDGEYRLTRYNGRHSSSHTNHWEDRRGLANASFGRHFHIHRATERYQVESLAIDGYAEVTDDYSDFDTALEAFLTGCGFSGHERAQARLFT